MLYFKIYFTEGKKVEALIFILYWKCYTQQANVNMWSGSNSPMHGQIIHVINQNMQKKTDPSGNDAA